jgi:drug/metabolite transporter (DMT)-like permease
LPVVGIALGAIVLGDPITANRVGGTLLIIAGIALVNSGPALRRLLTPRAQADAGAGAGST